MDVIEEIKEIQKDMIAANTIFQKSMSNVWNKMEKLKKELDN